MNNVNQNNSFFLKLRNYLTNNLRNIIIIVISLIVILAAYQVYNYVSVQSLKKTSIKFFKNINGSDEILESLDEIKDNKNIYSILSSLKIIKENNNNNNFAISNELYKEIISLDDIEILYKSSVAVHASYTMIDATYIENTSNYFNDISYFIENISDELENFYSIKMELKYLLIVAEGDINKTDYKNNNKALDLYENIINSNIISPTVKERVKKLHEFQLYK